MKEHMRNYGTRLWVGHIPKKYPYDPKFPKSTSQVRWFNMYNKGVQKGLRKSVDAVMAQRESLKPLDGFVLRRHTVPVRGGSIIMYEIAPTELVDKKNVPVIFNTHGGGFYFPFNEGEIRTMETYSKATGTKVFLPDYRTSIMEPFPTPFYDCVQSFYYMIDHADELGIDKDRIVIYGGSAGACLATELTMYLRDHNGVKARGQFLLIPVTDRGFKYPSHYEYEDAQWSENANEHAWDVYLPSDDVEMIEYAVPMEAKDVSNLPPAYIEPSEMDILRDQGVAYAKKLEEAGVPVELKVVKGGYHGSLDDPSFPAVQELMAHHFEVIRNFLK